MKKQLIEPPYPSSFGAGQNGFALVGSLVLLLILSVISTTGAQRSMLDERLASNHLLQTNSLSAAESGLLQAQVLANTSGVLEAVQSGNDAAIESAWMQGVAEYEKWINLSGAQAPQFRLDKVGSSTTYWNSAKKRFQVRSLGRVVSPEGEQLSLRDLGAEIASEVSLGSKKTNSFSAGVVGIHGAVLNGGSRINSFNSSYGTYGAEVSVDGETFINKHEYEDNDNFSGTRTRTCKLGVDVSISGNAPVFGDLISTGNLLMSGQTPVFGDVYVNENGYTGGKPGQLNGHIYGNLILKGNVILGNAGIVEGDVIVGGDFQSYGRVEGTVTVAGDAYFSSSSTTLGGVFAGGSVKVDSTGSPPPSIDSLGKLEYPSYYQYTEKEKVSNYHGNLPASSIDIPDIPLIDDSGAECASLEIRDPETGELGEAFLEVLNDPGTLNFGDWFDNNGCAYCYSSQGNFVLTGGQGNQDASSTVVGQDGQTTLLKVNGNVTTAGRLLSLTMKGHVTLLVDGDFSVGGATQLNIAPDATLTLMIIGKTLLGSGSNLISNGDFVRPGADGSLRPAVLVYSAYEGYAGSGNNAGVVISGSSDASIAVYAEYTRVSVIGSGDIYGSLIAGTIELKGSGDVHFDESLKRISDGGNGGGDGSIVGPARIISWWQSNK